MATTSLLSFGLQMSSMMVDLKDWLLPSFHVQDPKYITTDYEGSTVQTKPDIVLTSTVAAGDVNYKLNNQPAILACDKPPAKGFKM